MALVSEGTDVRALFKLSLMDQSGKGKHKVQSHFDRPLESGPYTLKYSGSMWGYKRFLRRSLLDTSDFVKDDTLKICCTVGVVVSVTESPNSHYVPIPETNLSQQFGELMENEETSDITFDVVGEKFYAHKLVLAARSPVFKSQFFGSSHEKNNKEIFIGDMQPKVFKAMLHFIYRDTLPDTDEHVWSPPVTASLPCPSTSTSMAECLLAAADRFMLDRLKSLCEAKIFQSISIDNVCTILSLAQCYLASQLKFECLKFAASNLEEVVQSEGFKYLKENRPSLQSELLETVARFEDDSGMIENSESTWSHDSDGFDSNSTEAQV